MNPINNQNSNKPTTSPRMQNNVGTSNPTVSQLNNAANRPEGLQQASQLQISDRHFTRLMRNDPQATFTQEDLKTISSITDPKKKEKVLERIVQHPNVPDDIRTAAEKLLQDVQKDLIYDKTYTAQNIWEAYTDAHKIPNPERQADFLKRVLQSHIDIEAFHPSQLEKFQDLIKDFAEPIRQNLYRLIVDSNQCPFLLRIGVLKATKLSLEEKELCLSNILLPLLSNGLNQYEIGSFQFLLRDFPMSIQNKLYIRIAKSDCLCKIRLGVLQLLDIPLDEKIQLCCAIFSEDFCQLMSGYFESPYLLDFLRSCSEDLRLELCAQIVKYDSLLSPFRMKIVELMKAGLVKDEALSAMVSSPFFKLEDKIALAKLINDSSLKLTLLEDLLVNYPYTYFEYSDKYEKYSYAMELPFEYGVLLKQRLRACNDTTIIQNAPKLRSSILKEFFNSLPVLNMNDFTDLLGGIFINGSERERKIIMLNFSKKVSHNWGNSVPNLKAALEDRFDYFYKAPGWDKETKKVFIFNLLQNQNCPLDFQKYALEDYLEEHPEERKAPAGGILEAIALDATIPVDLRQDILRTYVTNERVRDDLLLLTEEDHVMETRFKKMKLSAPNASDE